MRNSQLDISSRMERHRTRQHGWNSVLFRRPCHFEGTLATVLTPSDAAWLFLMGISERESYQNKPRTIDALKANITQEIQAVTADVLARTFQNMACWVQSCLGTNGGHFQHMLLCHISYTMRWVRFKFRCNILISGKIIKDMLGSVASGTHYHHQELQSWDILVHFFGIFSL